jgi:hypothetical protein
MSDCEKAFSTIAEPIYIMQYDTQDSLALTFLRREGLHYGNQIKGKGTGKGKGKGKAVPLQAWSGPEGSRKLRFPHYMTTAQDGDKVGSLTHRPPLSPGNTPGTHFC